MNILYLNTKVINNQDVKESLQKMQEVTITEHTGLYEKQEEYAKELLRIIEEKGIEMVLSLKYIPIVSIVCQAMKTKYAAWICSSYDKNIYSCTFLNQCNYIFFADYTLYREFKENGFQRIYYLPLAANVVRIKEVLQRMEVKEVESVDILMVQDIYTRERMSYNPLSLKSPLKDAVKGYLEGCIACQYQRSGLPSMAENLPPYVWKELTEKFTITLEKDSVESLSHYFDYQYFNSLITYADRDIHLNVWAENAHVKKTELYQKCHTYQSENVECHDRVSYEDSLPLVIKKGKINYVVTHRNWKSGISQICWDIMAAGGFLLSNYQADYLRVFPGVKPVLYYDEKDMLSKGIYYLHHEKERRELAEVLAKEVEQKHTYFQRLTKILQI